jgi:hypothetical protein
VGEGTVNWIEVAFVSMERHDDLCFDLLLNHKVLEELEGSSKNQEKQKGNEKMAHRDNPSSPRPEGLADYLARNAPGNGKITMLVVGKEMNNVPT